jgi:hypothetical protein
MRLKKYVWSENKMIFVSWTQNFTSTFHPKQSFFLHLCGGKSLFHQLFLIETKLFFQFFKRMFWKIAIAFKLFWRLQKKLGRNHTFFSWSSCNLEDSIKVLLKITEEVFSNNLMTKFWKINISSIEVDKMKPY